MTSNKNPFDSYWSANQIANEYKVSVQIVYQWEKKGWLPQPIPTPWGRMWLIADVKSSLQKHRLKG